MASMSENFLKKRTTTKRVIQCSKCSSNIEVPPTAQTIHCRQCNTYILVSRASRSISGNPLVMSKQVTNSGATQPRLNKRALLCGVSYRGLKYRLRGTINDVNRMQQFLTKRFNFPKQSIRILTEDQPKEEDTPTRKNIENALRWLVEDCQSGDSLVFYFSGHGLRQPDFNGDENDGFDETLCPVDFSKEGMILDNDINSIIVKPLPAGVKLHAIIDACHSGTILDLHYIYKIKSNKWEEDVAPSGRPPKGTSGGLAICFSACADSQRAVDTSIFSEKGKHIFARKDMYGAMTTLFIRAVESHSNITYVGILEFMNEECEAMNIRGRCFNRPSLRRMFNRGLLQEPQLSSSKDFDVDEKFEL
ncbi:hypothetical protein VitviT2T_004161 [Vitis vinifera]|nr:metacaspase-1 [Vitis vinifera]WJZ84561.1 hypothetical protein VitviT2T_004161 [Vitis vinifera]|eukprot:XP_010648164.1 PREDICTED: metacaspase-1 [Vitis vinifera]